ncbi:MAG: NERD domain-containing protein [Anaerolineales bacterium]|nr:NERD domain-containing protein [Anaerolineales bacterium]
MESLLPILLPPALLVALAVIFFLGYAVGKWGMHSAENTGEARVRQVLTTSFKAPEYHLLNNITLPYEDGTTQIDHILVSIKGVFVIETKHFSGWIFAGEKSQYWTQVIYNFRNKTPNPLHQNYRHVKAVRGLLDFLPREQIHSLVVFTGDAAFKTAVPKGVVYLHKLTEYLRRFDEDVITLNRLQFIVGRLECTRYEISRQTDVEHKAYLNRKYRDH